MSNQRNHSQKLLNHNLKITIHNLIPNGNLYFANTDLIQPLAAAFHKCSVFLLRSMMRIADLYPPTKPSDDLQFLQLAGSEAVHWLAATALSK